MGMYHMSDAVVGRHCHADRMLTLPMYNESQVIKFRSYRELGHFREGQEVHAHVCTGGRENELALKVAT